METVKVFIKNLTTEDRVGNTLFKRNRIKEYLQMVVLDFLYAHRTYSGLIFYGGSCLSHCFRLPRLSEDLDFVDTTKKLNLPRLAQDLQNFFRKHTDLEVTTTCQKFRIYLKFPILWELGLAKKTESNLLFLKVEVFKKFDFCKTYKTQIIPLFKFNKSMLVRTFDLETLMATKIRAILYRKWEKTDKTGKTLIKVKGRDYFDLMWYLEKEVSPNISCIESIKTKGELKEKLLAIIDNLDARSIQLDLAPLVGDKNFVKNLAKNIKEILRREVRTKL